MSDQILSSIYSFSKKFVDPISKLTFELKNNNIAAIVKDGKVNITLQIGGKNNQEYESISRLLKKNIEQIPNVLSVNIILTNDEQNESSEKRFKIDAREIIAIAIKKPIINTPKINDAGT